MNWSYGYSYGRNDRARSVANSYELGAAVSSRKNNLNAARSSVGRFSDEYRESSVLRSDPNYRTRAINSPFSGGLQQKKLNNGSALHRSTGIVFSNKSLDKRTDVMEMRLSLAEENSITPTPENLD